MAGQALQGGRVIVPDHALAAHDSSRARESGQVSMPSWELAGAQSEEYRRAGLPSVVHAGVNVEAASPLGREHDVGPGGAMIDNDHFGRVGAGTRSHGPMRILSGACCHDGEGRARRVNPPHRANSSNGRIGDKEGESNGRNRRNTQRTRPGEGCRSLGGCRRRHAAGPCSTARPCCWRGGAAICSRSVPPARTTAVRWPRG